MAMPERSRGPRKGEVVACTTGSPPEVSKKTPRGRGGEPGRGQSVAIDEQLLLARQELGKAQKISRELARNCARAEQEMRRREECLELVVRHGSDVLFRL